MISFGLHGVLSCGRMAPQGTEMAPAGAQMEASGLPNNSFARRKMTEDEDKYVSVCIGLQFEMYQYHVDLKSGPPFKGDEGSHFLIQGVLIREGCNP